MAQQPPILYAPAKRVLQSSVLTESIKVRLTSGNLSSSPCIQFHVFFFYGEVYNKGDNKKYLKHIMTLSRLQKDKGLKDKLLQVTKWAVMALNAAMKLCKVPTAEICEAKEERALALSAAEQNIKDSQEPTQVAAKSAYELFCQFVKANPRSNEIALPKTCTRKTPGWALMGRRMQVFTQMTGYL